MKKGLFMIVVFCTFFIVLSCKKDKKDENFAEVIKSNTSDSIAATDIGWPREVSLNGSKLVYYQPQVDQWKDFKEITA